ncbi:hypothetical protein C8Q73DRAFT_657877 [Cubamyces lactineus]|nr:hypothetical protein C8Q73DRAFT_657877 [Cubamyces lactineus]
MPATNESTSAVEPATTCVVSEPSPSPQPAAPVRTSTKRPALLLDDSDWPVWVRDAFNHMETKAFGEDFARAIEWWTVIERQYQWETSTKGLSTEHRPSEVSHWLRVLRRNLLRPPPIADEVEYCESWQRWWSGLQPSWRNQTEDQPLVPADRGEWGPLECPGKNGLLIILLSLLWWREAATDSTLDRWHAAIADVRWVAEAMAQHLLGQKR